MCEINERLCILNPEGTKTSKTCLLSCLRLAILWCLHFRRKCSKTWFQARALCQRKRLNGKSKISNVVNLHNFDLFSWRTRIWLKISKVNRKHCVYYISEKPNNWTLDSFPCCSSLFFLTRIILLNNKRCLISLKSGGFYLPTFTQIFKIIDRSYIQNQNLQLKIRKIPEFI